MLENVFDYHNKRSKGPFQLAMVALSVALAAICVVKLFDISLLWAIMLAALSASVAFALTFTHLKSSKSAISPELKIRFAACVILTLVVLVVF